MKKLTNYNFKVDLSNVLPKGNCLDWKNSIGRTIPFTCDFLDGELIIKEYFPREKKVITELNGSELRPISVQALKRGQLQGMLLNYLPSWKYQVGDIIKDKKRNITIIDKKIINNYRHYKIKCNICGYSSGAHWYKGKKRDEYWVREYYIYKGSQCPCCCPGSVCVVEGLNDIATTNRWMCDYFVDKTIPYKYRNQSGVKAMIKCPDCGYERPYIISNLFKFKRLPCKCSDVVSMPNKISYYTISNIPEFENYSSEYSPSWAKPYRYDNFFMFRGRKILIEMDGSVGHGKNKYKSAEKDTDGIKRDELKNQLASDNGFELYRIDCTSNNYHVIFTNLCDCIRSISKDVCIKSETEIMNLSSKNIIKEVCNYYNNVSVAHADIAKRFNIALETVMRYLEHGSRYGWCNYEKNTITKSRNKEISIDLYNRGFTISSIEEQLGVYNSTVRNYIKEAAAEGLCSYDSQKELQRARQKGINEMLKSTRKIVYVYDSGLNFICEYPSVSELERCSEKDFGIILKSRCVGRVCFGKRKKYKDFIFSYNKI